jgi:hypothetical protein
LRWWNIWASSKHHEPINERKNMSDLWDKVWPFLAVFALIGIKLYRQWKSIERRSKAKKMGNDEFLDRASTAGADVTFIRSQVGNASDSVSGGCEDTML